MQKFRSKYICQDKSITNEYTNKFALEKSTNVLANEYIRPNIFKYIKISEYSTHTVLDYFDHFHHFGNL